MTNSFDLANRLSDLEARVGLLESYVQDAREQGQLNPKLRWTRLKPNPFPDGIGDTKLSFPLSEEENPISKYLPEDAKARGETELQRGGLQPESVFDEVKGLLKKETMDAVFSKKVDAPIYVREDGSSWAAAYISKRCPSDPTQDDLRDFASAVDRAASEFGAEGHLSHPLKLRLFGGEYVIWLATYMEEGKRKSYVDQLLGAQEV